MPPVGFINAAFNAFIHFYFPLTSRLFICFPVHQVSGHDSFYFCLYFFSLTATQWHRICSWGGNILLEAISVLPRPLCLITSKDSSTKSHWYVIVMIRRECPHLRGRIFHFTRCRVWSLPNTEGLHVEDGLKHKISGIFPLNLLWKL